MACTSTGRAPPSPPANSGWTSTTTHGIYRDHIYGLPRGNNARGGLLLSATKQRAASAAAGKGPDRATMRRGENSGSESADCCRPVRDDHVVPPVRCCRGRGPSRPSPRGRSRCRDLHGRLGGRMPQSNGQRVVSATAPSGRGSWRYLREHPRRGASSGWWETSRVRLAASRVRGHSASTACGRAGRGGAGPTWR
jgi:hypothetical protein